MRVGFLLVLLSSCTLDRDGRRWPEPDPKPCQEQCDDELYACWPEPVYEIDPSYHDGQAASCVIEHDLCSLECHEL